ncbi:hypothetical protein HA45_12950 [Pantoea rodasii]|nr:hypothetical protein HA45_12950 [Pantoea rodasii]
MCQIVGCVVFALANAGCETRLEAISNVLNREILDDCKWAPEQIRFMQLAIAQLYPEGSAHSLSSGQD